MSFIADGLLLLAATSAAVYCAILSIRLRRLTDTDGSLHAAISTLNAEVDEMKVALEAAKKSTETAVGDLDLRIARATTASAALEDETASAGTVAAKISEALLKADDASEKARAAAADVKQLLIDVAETTSGLDAATRKLAVATEPPGPSVAREEEDAGEAETRSLDVKASVEEHEVLSVDAGASSQTQGGPPIEQDDASPATAEATSEAPSLSSLENAPEVAPSEAPSTSPKDEASSEPVSSEPMQALLAMREAEDDTVFASRLVEALSNLEPKRVEETAQ